jgi:hypothetical protein
VGEDWRALLVRIEPEHRDAAEAILGKLDDGLTPWGSKAKLAGRARGPGAAFERLLELGILVSIGGSQRTPQFAINRGAATARIEKAAKPPKAPRARKPTPPPVDPSRARNEMAAALAASRDPWIAKNKLCAKTATAKAAYEQLIQDGTIVELGKLGSTEFVTASKGHPAFQVPRDLASEVIAARGMRDALTAMPIEPTDKFWKGMLPSKVQDSFQAALKILLGSGRAVKLDGAGMGLFVLASSIHTASAELIGAAHPTPAAAPKAPDVDSASQPRAPVVHGIDAERVREAYRQLATRQRAVHVTVADLWRDSGVPLAALKSWLLAECQAHRADPALGEPSLATPEQLAAALDIDGRPHLYIQLENT